MRSLGPAVAALLLVAAPAGAQRLPIRHYTTSDGLAHNIVVSLHEDRHGYLWIGTAEGVSHFDGEKFVTYGRREGLPAVIVTAFAETAEGRLWIASTPRALFEFLDVPAGTSNGVTQLFRSQSVGEAAAANRVYSLAVDGGVLWAATDEGLYRAALAHGDMRFERALPGDSTDYAGPSFQDSSGRVWLGMRNRLITTSPSASVVQELPASSTQSNDIVGIAETQDGALFVAASHGLFRRHRLGAAFDRVEFPLLPAETILAVAAAGELLWIGTSHGLLRRQGDTVVRYDATHGVVPPVLSLHRSQAGVLWIGGTAGLRALVSSGTIGFTNPGGGGFVRVLASKDSLIAATWGDVVRVDAGNVLHRQAAGGMKPGARIARGPGGTTWIGTDEGVFVLSPDLREVSASAGVPRATLWQQGDQETTGMHLDTSGAMWLATADDRLIRCRAPRPRAIACEDVPHSGVSWRRRPVTIADDGRGTVWVASTTGLGRFRADRFERVRVRPDAETDPELTPSIAIDRRGRLWAGFHHDGIALAADPTAAAPVFEMRGTLHGLSSDAVYDFAEAPDGAMYVATGRGLDRVRNDGGSFRASPVDIGFETREVHDLEWSSPDVLWVAAASGLYRANMSTRPATSPVPRARFTRILVRGVEHPLPQRGVDSIRGLVLGAGQDDVRVEFIAPHVGRASPTYQYRLAHDDEWSVPQKDPVLTLAALEPGRYLLAIRAASDGAVSDPAELEFELLAPVWRRTWVQAIALTILAGGVWGAQRTRGRRRLALERIRRQIAADLHDDVGSRLAEIAVMSEVGAREAATGSGERFTQLASIARDVRAVMSDVVWAVDPRKDHLSDLVARIRVSAESLLDPAVDVRVSASPGTVVDHTALGPDERRQLLLIVRESLVNVQKHAGATVVSIDVAVARGTLTITIEDNGVGIESVDEVSGLGLHSMLERAEAIGGSVRVERRPSGGTRVVVQTVIGAAGVGARRMIMRRDSRYTDAP